jgi:flagellar protein FliO/FliZ
MVQTTLALLFVLALVFALAWFSRRVRAAANPGMARIEVLAQAALGTKERAVLVQVGSVQLLLGVAPGSVRALHRLTESEAFPTAANAATHAAAQPTNFSDLLRRSLDRS